MLKKACRSNFSGHAIVGLNGNVTHQPLLALFNRWSQKGDLRGLKRELNLVNLFVELGLQTTIFF
jgi:hypothetical protein